MDGKKLNNVSSLIRTVTNGLNKKSFCELRSTRPENKEIKGRSTNLLEESGALLFVMNQTIKRNVAFLSVSYAAVYSIVKRDQNYSTR